MNGLVRFRTRDGRYRSGGYAGTPVGGLHAVAGPPRVSGGEVSFLVADRQNWFGLNVSRLVLTP